jgi:hypothetical protein
MIDEAGTRLRNNISQAEFERRWKCVRQAMEEQRLDFLILQSCSDFLGGYVKYFTDLPSTIYPVTIIFPLGEEMTSILHGPTPPAQPNPPLWTARGKEKISLLLCLLSTIPALSMLRRLSRNSLLTGIVESVW